MLSLASVLQELDSVRSERNGHSIQCERSTDFPTDTPPTKPTKPTKLALAWNSTPSTTNARPLNLAQVRRAMLPYQYRLAGSDQWLVVITRGDDLATAKRHLELQFGEKLAEVRPYEAIGRNS
jgi:hypothetical protein